MSQPQQREPTDRASYPPFPEGLPDRALEHGRLRVRFARREGELDAVLRLRFEVFNLELGEGFDASFSTGRDEDRFDTQCHHLLVEDRATGVVLGTYRLQTYEMARRSGAFYSDGEYVLEAMPEEIRRDSVELGRACIRREHRNRQVLFMLWRGLALYVRHSRKRYLFGCCSLTSQRAAEGVRLYRQLAAEGRVRDDFDVPPRPACRCAASDEEVAVEPEVQVPALFGTYLRYGARLCSGPALDREFKTIDYLVLLDIETISDKSRELFFAGL